MNYVLDKIMWGKVILIILKKNSEKKYVPMSGNFKIVVGYEFAHARRNLPKALFLITFNSNML